MSPFGEYLEFIFRTVVSLLTASRDATEARALAETGLRLMEEAHRLEPEPSTGPGLRDGGLNVDHVGRPLVKTTAVTERSGPGVRQQTQP